MKNIWSTSVKKSIVDEAPMAYKPKGEIMENIEEIAEIIDIIRPLEGRGRSRVQNAVC